jgi:hypothetical protein
MIRKLLVVLALLSAGLTGASGTPAQARNEDVPKGPAAAPPRGSIKPSNSQSPTGSVNNGDKKGAPSGGGSSSGGGSKSVPPAK